MDRRVLPIAATQVTTTRGLMALTVVTVFVSGLPDLQWAGSYTYLSRALQAAAVLVVVLSAAAAVRVERPERAPQPFAVPARRYPRLDPDQVMVGFRDEVLVPLHLTAEAAAARATVTDVYPELARPPMPRSIYWNRRLNSWPDTLIYAGRPTVIAIAIYYVLHFTVGL
jgi:hypothetical protein